MSVLVCKLALIARGQISWQVTGSLAFVGCLEQPGAYALGRISILNCASQAASFIRAIPKKPFLLMDCLEAGVGMHMACWLQLVGVRRAR